MDINDAFARLSEIGATPDGGMHRLSISEVDGRARDWLVEQLHATGATVHIDQIGNVFGLYEFVPDAPYVLTGSHIDSQPTGGKYDGAYGVMASLAAAVDIVDQVRTGVIAPVRNLAVVNWTNEEGARFQPSLMGSSVFTGNLPISDALSIRDAAGVSVEEALKLIGYRGQEPLAVPIAGYAEIHVEQSRHLELRQIDTAVVTGSWAAYKYNVVVRGEQSHTGATPMRERRDALLGAALIISGVRRIADECEEGLLHSSVTELRPYPESPNVVTARASMHIELRSASYEALKPAEEQLLALFDAVRDSARVDVEIEQSWHRQAAIYWPAGERVALEAAERARVSIMPLLTVSGHDSIEMNKVAPTVMMFVPAMGGYAHSAREYTAPADMEKGCTLIREVLRHFVEGDLDRTGYPSELFISTASSVG